MNFTISKSVFYDALQKVVGVVPPKTTISILTCILLELEENTLRITGTDLEISVTLSLNVNRLEDGAVAIPARLLLEIVRELPDVPLNIASEGEERIILKTDKGEYKISTDPREDFPKTNVEEGEFHFPLESKVLDHMINKTIFAVSADELRPALTGILVEFFPTEIRFVATDGHRLARIVHQREMLQEAIQNKIIVPTKALNLLLRNLEPNKNVDVQIGEDHIVFTLENSTIYSKLISGMYPNYERVIPQDNDKILQVNRELLISTLRRVSIFSNSLTHQVRFILTPDELTIHSEDIEFGAEATEVISAKYKGEWMQIGYNSAYLMDVLRHLDSEEVIFELKNAVSAAIMYPPEQESDENVTMLLMPIRLTEEEDEEEDENEVKSEPVYTADSTTEDNEQPDEGDAKEINE
ncbi:MAG: DNA polymerase III subunit beta [Actinobacteria bacterium]|nr:DNA polymerase III subunit beta [Actinomycetota bacterium]